MLDEGVISLLLVSMFLVFSAFFSSSEAAFLSLQRTRMTHLVNIGLPGARKVSDMIAQPERLLATILLGQNLMNVAFASLVTVAAVSFVGDGNEGQGVAIATLISTIALLLVGEIIPKTIFTAMNKNGDVFLWPVRLQSSASRSPCCGLKKAKN